MNINKLELPNMTTKETDSPTKEKWEFDKQNGEFISKIVKHKVDSVTETRTGPTISWKGELADDNYFLIIVIEGIIYAAISEHEMMLPYELYTIAYSSLVSTCLEQENEIVKSLTLSALRGILNERMLNLTFEDIMKLFMWEYVSTKVKVDKTILT